MKHKLKLIWRILWGKCVIYKARLYHIHFMDKHPTGTIVDCYLEDSLKYTYLVEYGKEELNG